MAANQEVLNKVSKLLGFHELNLPICDERCVKCGSTSNLLRYIAADRRDGFPECPFAGRREHFHRWCNRCQYQWSTDDVLKGEPDGGAVA